jgi:hypothetical protein
MSVDREDLQGTLERTQQPPRRHGRFTRAHEAESVDEPGHTKQELYERAKELDIPRRSAMTKGELARAIARRQG